MTPAAVATVGSASPWSAGWRRRALIAAASALSGAAMISGCGHEPEAVRAHAATAMSAAVSANSSCVRVAPVVEKALSALRRFRRGRMTAVAAQRQLSLSQVKVEKLIGATPNTVLQEAMAEASDAFAAFRAVLRTRDVSAYGDTATALDGDLISLARICPVANPGFEADISGWQAVNPNTALSRSGAAYDGRWSLRVANAGKRSGAAGFTDSPEQEPTALSGSEQVALWARAVAGTPAVTVQVREMAGTSVLDSREVRVRLGASFRLVDLTFHVRRPGFTRLSVRVWAPDLAPGAAFLVDDITIVRD